MTKSKLIDAIESAIRDKAISHETKANGWQLVAVDELFALIRKHEPSLTEFAASSNECRKANRVCSGRTNGFGGFTCVHCHSTYSRESVNPATPPASPTSTDGVDDESLLALMNKAVIASDAEAFGAFDLRGETYAEINRQNAAALAAIRPYLRTLPCQHVYERYSRWDQPVAPDADEPLSIRTLTMNLEDL